MGKIKLWITDIDGTIVDETNVFSPVMLETIEKVKKSGTKMVLATGRMFKGAKPVADYLGLDTPVVCYQGAMVRLNDDILWQSPVKNHLAREVIDFLRKKNIHTNLYNNDELIVEDDNKRMMSEYCTGRFVTYSTVENFDDVELKNVSKLLAIIEDEETMVNTAHELSAAYNGVLSIVRSNKNYLEVTDINATKGSALNYLANLWGIKKEEIMASGDHDNDYEMLKNAGIAIAMGNATEKLKTAANCICGNIKEDGICEMVERYILCG